MCIGWKLRTVDGRFKFVLPRQNGKKLSEQSLGDSIAPWCADVMTPYEALVRGVSMGSFAPLTGIDVCSDRSIQIVLSDVFLGTYPQISAFELRHHVASPQQKLYTSANTISNQDMLPIGVPRNLAASRRADVCQVSSSSVVLSLKCAEPSEEHSQFRTMLHPTRRCIVLHPFNVCSAFHLPWHIWHHPAALYARAVYV
jgi:hypothetical protein